MSTAKDGQAVCDAGLKVQSVDSGLPVIFGREDVSYVACSDEHGIIEDRQNKLKINEKLCLIPGYCDPHATYMTGMFVCGTEKLKNCGPLVQEGKAW